VGCAHRSKRLASEVAPNLLAVLQIPLVGECHHALVAAAAESVRAIRQTDKMLNAPTAHNWRLRLAVRKSVTSRYQAGTDDRLALPNSLPSVSAHEHDALSEALQVGAMLSLVQQSAIVLAANLQLSADSRRCSIAELLRAS